MARLFTTARPHLASHEQIIMHGVAMDMCTRAQTLLKRERYAFFERVGTTSKRESFRDSAAAMLVAATLFGVPGEVAAGALAQAEAHVLLDVPYVSQTPELCGGAAVAMVLRYWGERDVFPQDFA
jgi:hypothetical protein